MTTQSLRISACLEREVDPAFVRRAKIILENLEATAGMKILEVGCGRGFYEQAVLTVYSDVEIVGIDTSEKYLAVARQKIQGKRVSFVKADGRELPFKDNSFDRVICSEVLEHIKEDTSVLKEIYRVLKSSGLALITVPNKNYPFFWDPLNFTLERVFQRHVPSDIWWLAGIWAGHQRLYREKELTDKLRYAGFEVVRVWRLVKYSLPFSHFLLYGLGKNLVERGVIGGGFNRFNFSSQPSFLLKLVKSFFSLFDSFNRDDKQGSRFVNLVINVRK